MYFKRDQSRHQKKPGRCDMFEQETKKETVMKDKKLKTAFDYLEAFTKLPPVFDPKDIKRIGNIRIRKQKDKKKR